MIKLNYKSWSDVHIGLYYRISDICKQDLEPLDKNVKLISLLSDIPEDEVWGMSMSEAESAFEQLQWLWSFNFPKNYRGKDININGQSYNVCTDLKDFTISQYIDFQEYWPKLKESEEGLSQILTTIIKPEGKKYNIGYDTSELSKVLEEFLPITTAESILYFFLVSLARSIRATEICYNLMMKILKRKAKTKEEKEQIKVLTEQTLKLIKEAQHIIGSL